MTRTTGGDLVPATGVNEGAANSARMLVGAASQKELRLTNQ